MMEEGQQKMCFVSKDKQLNISHSVFEGTTERPGGEIADMCKYGSVEQGRQEIQSRSNGVDGD